MTGQVHALNYLKHCRGGDFVADPSMTYRPTPGGDPCAEPNMSFPGDAARHVNGRRI